MARLRQGKLKAWQDMYYDGKIEYEDYFCEDTQDIIENDGCSGWDDYEKLIEDEYEDMWEDDEE